MININFKTEEMTEKYALAISKWRYPNEMSIYSFDGDNDEFEQVMNGLHYAVVNQDNGELCGFFSIGWAAQVKCRASKSFYLDESFSDLGLGLRPDLVGQGLGRSFVNEGIRFIKELFQDDGVRLTVLEDNKVAIKTYISLGFITKTKFSKGFFRKRKYIMMVMS